MTSDEKNQLLEKAADDIEFRLRLLRNPAGAAAELGIVLSDEQIEAFIRVTEAILRQDLPEEVIITGVVPIFRSLPPGQ